MKSKKKKRAKKDRNPWNNLRVRHACPRVSEKIGDRIQVYPPDSATLQGWIDGSIKPPVQSARSTLVLLAQEVLTWRENYLRSKRLSAETKSGTIQIEIPKKAADVLFALLGGGQ